MKNKLLQPWNAKQWLTEFHQPDCDYRMLRRQVYAYTVQAVRQGFYEIIKKDPETNKTKLQTITLPLDSDITKNTKMYHTEQHRSKDCRAIGQHRG